MSETNTEKVVHYTQEGQVVDKDVTHLVIGPTVTFIPNNAFGPLRKSRAAAATTKPKASKEEKEEEPQLRVSPYQSLVEVQLHDTVAIGANAFAGCQSLQVVKIPREASKTPKAVVEKPLDDDDADPDNLVVVVTSQSGDESTDNVDENKEEVKTVSESSTEKTEMLDDDGVDLIGMAAFEDCANLKSVDIPSCIGVVSDSAFKHCVSLEKVMFPEFLKRIGREAFSGCGSLDHINYHSIPPGRAVRGKTIKFPPFLETIEFAAFRGCAFDEVKIPKSVLTIGEWAFGEIPTLQRVVSRSRNLTIGDNAFAKCDFDVAMGEFKNTDPHPDIIASALEGDHFQKRLRKLILTDTPKLAKMAIASQQMQRALNKRMSEPGPCFFLLLEGYANIGTISALIHSSTLFLQEGEQSISGNVWLFIFGMYFLVKEVMQAAFAKWAYVEDVWNVLDIARVAFIFASASCMLTRSGGADVEEPVRNLLLVSGAITIISGILFLRMTFLPFAEFVGGLTNIFAVLFPFLVVSILLIFAFAYMFYVRGFDASEDDDPDGLFESLSSSILNSFSFFFAGPETTADWWLDLLFGFTIVVILLNVVIAVVSDAWSESIQLGSVTFWEYRVRFLVEVESLEFLLKCCNCGGDLGYDNVSIKDNIPWKEYPYSLAERDFEMYNNPTPERLRKVLLEHDEIGEEHEDVVLETLIEARSIERDWHWAQQGKMNSLSVFYNFAVYILLICLGVFTCGLLWPLRFREYMFVHEFEAEPEKSEPEKVIEGAISKETDQMKRETTSIKRDTESIQGALRKVELQLIKIEGQIAQLETLTKYRTTQLGTLTNKRTTDLETLTNERSNQLEMLSAQLEALTNEKTTMLETLTNERTTGVETLTIERTTKLEELTNERTSKLEALTRERVAAMEALTQERTTLLEALTNEKTEKLESLTNERIAMLDKLVNDRIAQMEVTTNTRIDELEQSMRQRITKMETETNRKLNTILGILQQPQQENSSKPPWRR